MMGTKPSWATLATFCGSVTPSNRRTATYIALAYLLHIEGGTGRPRLKLINVPSVKGCKASRNFGELRECEVQHSPAPIGQGRRRGISRLGREGCSEVVGVRVHKRPQDRGSERPREGLGLASLGRGNAHEKAGGPEQSDPMSRRWSDHRAKT